MSMFRPKRFVKRVFNRVATPGGEWYDISLVSNNVAVGSATSYRYETITLPRGGTATKLRCYIGQFNAASDVKGAIYDSGGTLLANGTAAVTGVGYVEIILNTSVIVTATNYKLAFQMSDADSYFGYQSTTGSTFRSASLAYADFPETPIGAGSGFGTLTHRFGVFVA